MAGKLKFIVGLGAGYVLGTRQGREQYDKIVEKAQTLWRNPKVQDAAGKVQHVAEEKVGSGSGSSSSGSGAGSSNGGSSTASAGSSGFGSRASGPPSGGSSSGGSTPGGTGTGGSSSGGTA